MKSIKHEDTKPHGPLPHNQRERDDEYSRLRVWDDEDTQVSKPISMSDLVNGTDNRPKPTKPS